MTNQKRISLIRKLFTAAAIPTCVAVVSAGQTCDPDPIGVFSGSTGSAYNLEALGDTAYGAGGVLDVSDARQPAFVRPIDWRIRDLAVRGDLGVIASDSFMRVLDLSDPRAPVELGRATASREGTGFGVAIDGDVAFMCGPDQRFEVLSFLRSYDISDPANPRLLDELILGGSGYDVEAHDGLVYFANGSLLVFDARNPADLRLVSQRPRPAIADVVVRDGLLYASGDEGLSVFDLEDPQAPRLLGSSGGFFAYGDLVLRGDLAFVANRFEDQGVHVVDVRDATRPRLLTTVRVTDGAEGVAVAGDVLYGSSQFTGIELFDLSGCLACPADLDGDGALTLFDFLEFQNRFDAGDPIADFDGDGALTLFDFLAFQNLFAAGDPIADFDGDGELTIFDFLTFQNLFDAGCR
ncbi:MAG: GC-type dockerin domain-anchored protein [Phycisphaerales bacterium JB060]